MSSLSDGPLIVDLFCGAGGASEGYRRAGFRVVGVDISPQPHYPFPFHQGDALGAVKQAIVGEGFWPGGPKLGDVAAIAASPVCKLWSAATPEWARKNHVDYITPLRPLLQAARLPYVIENVPRAPLRPDVKICGCMVGLPEIKRERWFELGGWPVPAELVMRSPCHHPLRPVTVTGHGEPSGPRRTRIVMSRAVITITGDRGKHPRDRYPGMPNVHDWRRVMDIPWMTRDELSQAIPPPYTELIGRYLLEHLDGR